MTDAIFRDIQSGSIASVDVLVEKWVGLECSPFAAESSGLTILHSAIHHKRNKLALALIETGKFDEVIKSYSGSNNPYQPLPPLHFAARGNNAEVVTALAAAGAPLDQFSELIKSTPLIEAARAGATEAIEALIAAGADPLQRDTTGRVALVHAMMWNKTEAALRLVELSPGDGAFEALSNVADKGGINTLHNAVQFKSKSIHPVLAAVSKRMVA